MPLTRITVFCFAASYGLAMLLELVQVARPRRWLRYTALATCGAGLIAHSLYLIAKKPPLASQSGSLLTLAWILAVYSFFGSLHHRRLAWALFVLPVALGLILLAVLSGAPSSPDADSWNLFSLNGDEVWRQLHVALFVLASVGICVAFVASCMFLVQAARLKNKNLAGGGMRLLSQERLETTQRRALGVAFPLLTAGLLLSLMRMLQSGVPLSWTDPRILSTLILWLVFAVLVCLRLGAHLRGRRSALLTIVTFALLLLSLATSHHGPVGGTP
jgi:ABC-type transport system involved in cytochrome c biogenesis permease subunit